MSSYHHGGHCTLSFFFSLPSVVRSFRFIRYGENRSKKNELVDMFENEPQVKTHYILALVACDALCGVHTYAINDRTMPL